MFRASFVGRMHLMPLPPPRVVGLLLAAGAGRRMGNPKALVVGEDGVPWVVTSARTLRAGGCETVVVVVGAAAEQVTGLLAAEPVQVVESADWNEGMGASLRTGLSYLLAGSPGIDAALVHLVDLPDVGADAIGRVARQASAEVLARATYGSDGSTGHPVLLGRDHWAGVVATATGDRGARDYLGERDVLEIDCSDLARGHDVDRLP